MAFDGVVLHAVIDELSGLLTGGRVEKIFQPEPGELVMLIHASSEHYRLLLSADPASARIHLTRSKKENPALPPPFCMVLRKYLTGARLSAVRQQGFDRVAVLEFETRNEMGDNEIKRLVLEIMNRQSNIILLNSAGIIHDAIRHADFSVNRYREIMPARPYTPPPAQDKISPLDLTPELIKRTLSEAASQTVSKCLLSVADGFSPMLCDA
ncbi:MAG: NFACT family protein, partial [Clostridia bacterium]|nr:NFACT family protein [Clostridia bacterium]